MKTNILTNYLKCFTTIPGNYKLNLGQWNEKAWTRDLEQVTYLYGKSL